jgi:hypothetical protein
LAAERTVERSSDTSRFQTYHYITAGLSVPLTPDAFFGETGAPYDLLRAHLRKSAPKKAEMKLFK